MNPLKVVDNKGKTYASPFTDSIKAYEKKTSIELRVQGIKILVVPTHAEWNSDSGQWLPPKKTPLRRR